MPLPNASCGAHATGALRNSSLMCLLLTCSLTGLPTHFPRPQSEFGFLLVVRIFNEHEGDVRCKAIHHRPLTCLLTYSTGHKLPHRYLTRSNACLLTLSLPPWLLRLLSCVSLTPSHSP